MKNDTGNRTQEETALERFKIISPILSAVEENADKAKIGQLKTEAYEQAGVSRKTLARWLSRYAKDGFDGLKYQGSPTEPKRLIPGEIVKEAVLLRLEVPSSSRSTVIDIRNDLNMQSVQRNMVVFLVYVVYLVHRYTGYL